VVASERDDAARATWRARIQPQDASDFLFVDEAGAHLALSPRYAWALRGQRAPGQVPRNWGKNTTVLVGLSVRGLQAPWTIEGAVDTDAFVVYVEQVLCPTLRPGQKVFIDNLSVHKAARIHALIEARDCELIYLPAYSPDFTPVEQAFSKMKAILRQLAARTREALLDGIAVALDAVTAEDALGWFTHAGYRILPQPL
jgi:transposase